MTNFINQFDFNNLSDKLNPTKWTGSMLDTIQYTSTLLLAYAYMGYPPLYLAIFAIVGLTAKHASWALVCSLIAVGYGRKFGPSWIMYVGLMMSYYLIYGITPGQSQVKFSFSYPPERTHHQRHPKHIVN